MQLRSFAATLRRFWLLIVALPLLVGGVSFALALAAPPSYQATTRVMISQRSLGRPDVSLPDFDLRYTWDSSSYLLDDIPIIVSSSRFADDVAAQLAAKGTALEAGAARGAFSAVAFHRSVTVAATSGSPERTVALLHGAIAALQDGGMKYWGREGNLSMAVIDPPPAAAARIGNRRAALFNAGLRAALALAAAVGLAMLAGYLDDRLRNVAQAEQWIGSPVLAAIPKER